jgi:hypothetical protein
LRFCPFQRRIRGALSRIGKTVGWTIAHMETGTLLDRLKQNLSSFATHLSKAGGAGLSRESRPLPKLGSRESIARCRLNQPEESEAIGYLQSLASSQLTGNCVLAE